MSHSLENNELELGDQNLLDTESGSETEASLQADEEVSVPESLDEIRDDLRSLHEMFSSKLKYDQAKEKAFDRLYNELEQSKRDSSFEDNRPLFIDLILLYDRLDQFKTAAEITPSVIESLQEELYEILLRRNISKITMIDYEFTPARQQGVMRQPVDNERLDGKVVSITREGFVYEDKVIRPQEVVLGHYAKPSEMPVKESPESNEAPTQEGHHDKL